MSFPVYPSYEDSSVEWLGHVPSHWTVMPIYRVASFNDEVLTESTPADQEIKYVEISGISAVSGVIETQELQFGSAPSRARRVVRDGDILISTVRTYLRAIASVPKAPDNLIASTGFCVLRPRHADSGFLGYAVRSEAFISEVIARSVGVSYPAINASDLVRISLAMPPELEQVAIAAFLDRETAKIDALIEEQRRLIALLKEKRQAIISHAVTKGLDPHAPMKDSGIEWLGEVPEHWAVSKLRHLTRQIVDGAHFTPTYVDDGVPFLRVTDITRRRINMDEVKRIPVEEHDELIRRCNPQIGDLLLSKNGTIGVPMVIDWEWDFSIFVSLCLIKFNERLDAHFAKDVFLSKAIEVQISADAKQSTVTNLHLEKIAGFAFPVPPIDEQRAISAFVQRTVREHDGLIVVAEEAIDLLGERRAALISAAVTGKIDVRASAKVLPFPIDRAGARGLIATEIIERSAHQATFGRVKFQKIAFLAEAHVGISELAGSYTREAAGPLDRALIEEMESGARSIAGIERDQPGGSGTTNTYRLGPQRGAHRQELADWLGEDRTAKLDKLIGDFAALSTKEAEAVATLYGVWNDALSEGATPSDDEIISGFLNDWHPEKRAKFRASELPVWLGWMRRHGIVPTGSGPKTATGRLFV
ncbi:restriction endonuclease subunit S [Sphingomonas sanguinis]|uniref:restriction endonuclease subunit S n=1 Tax=Sphingomonas sp. LC-1 TaxID=3110957 RepID=UPI0021BAF103|nr:restriction endonuclease subunit S [Sphingomonas sp. LC-1]MCT8004003.1 restriction endonuclease subunit S [Sphingomonas sp. LC-1]